MSDVPDEVRALVQERQQARVARDFARADALRDRIAEMGFRVVDGPGGPTFEPIAPAAPTRVRASDVASVLDEPATVDVSVHWVVEGWPEDVVRARWPARQRGGRPSVRRRRVTETDPNVYGDDVEV
jgi:hypothetical protein